MKVILSSRKKQTKISTRNWIEKLLCAFVVTMFVAHTRRDAPSRKKISCESFTEKHHLEEELRPTEKVDRFPPSNIHFLTRPREKHFGFVVSMKKMSSTIAVIFEFEKVGCQLDMLDGSNPEACHALLCGMRWDEIILTLDRMRFWETRGKSFFSGFGSVLETLRQRIMRFWKTWDGMG